MNTVALAKNIKATVDPVVTLYEDWERLEQQHLEADVAADEVLDALPRDARRARVKYSHLLTPDGQEPIYLYSEEDIISRTQRYIDFCDSNNTQEWKAASKKARLQQENLLAEFRSEQKRIQAIHDEVGYTLLLERCKVLGEQMSALRNILITTRAQTTEGVLCQVKWLCCWFGINECEPQKDDEVVVKSIRQGLEQILAAYR